MSSFLNIRFTAYDFRFSRFSYKICPCFWVYEIFKHFNIFYFNTCNQFQYFLKDFNNLTSYRLLLERTNQNGHEILTRSNEHDAIKLDAKLNSVDDKWKSMIVLLTSLKEKFMAKNKSVPSQQSLHASNSDNESEVAAAAAKETPIVLTSYQILTSKFAEQNEWLNKCEKLVGTSVSPADELETERLLFEIKVSNREVLL
jgi:hypothetical protein